MDKNVKIYSPESSIRRPRVLFGEMWRDLVQSRDLAAGLALRDFRAQYRQSILGVFWIFLLPLGNTLTWVFLRRTGVVSVIETDIPYPIYVFTGAMIWSIFAESIQSPLQKVLANKSLLAKINFPREALILSSIYHSFVNAGVKVILMVLGMLVLGYNFLEFPFLLFPIGIIALILAGTAIGLVLTPLSLLYNDVSKGLPVVLPFLMYLSPVVFAIPKAGWVATFMSYNPLTPLVVVSRDWMTGNSTIFLQGFVKVNVVVSILLIVAWIVYRAAMPVLTERMSS